MTFESIRAYFSVCFLRLSACCSWLLFLDEILFIIKFLNKSGFAVDIVAPLFVDSLCACEPLHYKIDLEIFFVFSFKFSILYIHVVLRLEVRIFLLALFEIALMDMAQLSDGYPDSIWLPRGRVHLAVIRAQLSCCSVSKSIIFKNCEWILWINFQETITKQFFIVKIIILSLILRIIAIPASTARSQRMIISKLFASSTPID